MLSAKANPTNHCNDDLGHGGFLPFCLYIVMTFHSPFLPGENRLQLHSYVFESQLHVLLRQFITSLKLFLEK